MSAHPPDDAAVLRAALTLRAEGAARSVLPALDRAGVEPVVLKGPALAAWLYRDGAPRTFGDLDLLVDPGSWGVAQGVLAELGYERGQAGWDRLSYAWRRPGVDFAIDLHRSIVGAGTAPAVVWRELRAAAVADELLGVRCRRLAEPGLALHVATHAAQHALDGERKPLEDLRRALAAADAATWSQAAELARRIEAEPAFAAGLRRRPEGVELAGRLGLGSELPLDVALRASADPPPLVLGIEQLRRIEGMGPRLRFAASKVFPSAAQLRAGSALARRGRVGLAVARVARPFVVALELPRAIARHRSMGRAAAEQRPQQLDDEELTERDQRQGEPPGGTG